MLIVLFNFNFVFPTPVTVSGTQEADKCAFNTKFQFGRSKEAIPAFQVDNLDFFRNDVLFFFFPHEARNSAEFKTQRKPRGCTK